MNRVNYFNECLQYYNLIYLGFFGLSFTWTNSRSSNNLILERLDCALCNLEWNFLFLEAFVVNYLRILFDHALIIVSLFKSYPLFLQRPFRFETYCLSHLRFQNLIGDAWKYCPPLDQVIDNFVKTVLWWNQNIFGNVFKRKLCVLARLKGVQITLKKY